MCCLKIPEAIPDDVAVMLADVLPTAWHATELGEVREGDRVAVWGAGPGDSLLPCQRLAVLNGVLWPAVLHSPVVPTYIAHRQHMPGEPPGA